MAGGGGDAGTIRIVSASGLLSAFSSVLRASTSRIGKPPRPSTSAVSPRGNA